MYFNSFLGNVYRRIKDIDKTDIDNANKLGFKIKLLGFAEQLNNKIYQKVHPALIKKDSYVAVLMAF